MLYQKLKPSPDFLPYVDSYFFWEDSTPRTTPFEAESPPNGYTAFVFNYGDPYEVHQPGGVYKTSPAFLAGQATSSYRLVLPGKIAMAGIVFKPAAICSIFGFGMRNMTNRRVDLERLLGKEILLISEQLPRASSLEDRRSILEAFLAHQLNSRKVKPNYVDRATELMIQHKGKVNIQQLAGQLNVCTRQFQRSFLHKVGLNPKEYAVLLRLGNVCNLLIHQQEINWHDVILDAGYYDQAHFIKDFSNFIGRNPASYYRFNKELLSQLS
ncbi:helix-turn-helix domain-containing protein [Cesiribacter sp. SM1]|uniref:helix-turn-helix domain-containing protein n=1 Tax=Cesiribacter sp. SM1 TaxID=2861196 RepID=UPI001CD265E1|nr:helix-turn-helix domain-containing protein [Cesiribacter sp. SM1]